MNGKFEIAAGSFVGRDHLGRSELPIGRNNQDAYLWRETPDGIIMLVADGCGSGANSEVGAKLGLSLIARAIEQNLSRVMQNSSSIADNDAFWRKVNSDVVARLRSVVLDLTPCNGSFSETVQNSFLFTVVGAVITEDRAYLLGVGDGFYVTNDELWSLGPFQNNQPPYLAYQLVETKFSETPELLALKPRVSIATQDLENLLIGSDGLEDFIAAEERLIPGTTKPVGPLSQFTTEDRYFSNPDAVRRKLSQMNREVHSAQQGSTGLKVERGLLRDDTTLIAVRRVAREGGEQIEGSLHSGETG